MAMLFGHINKPCDRNLRYVNGRLAYIASMEFCRYGSPYSVKVEVKYPDGSEQTFVDPLIEDVKKGDVMTGPEALLELVANKKRVRMIHWIPGRFLSMSDPHVIDSGGYDRASVHSSVTFFDWKSGDWEFFKETCDFNELMEKLTPGRTATTSLFPGKVLTMIKDHGLCFKVENSPFEKVPLTRELTRAKFLIS